MNHRLSNTFHTFAESECKDSSPLYYALSQATAQDEAVLDIAAHATPGQPVPNLLFASVHYLLCAGIPHPLSAFYPTCTLSSAHPLQAFPYFKDFVLTYRAEIIALLTSRLVQTNEVRRSAYLFPALVFAASQFAPRPLALVEIGTSAGLNLLWDRYRYAYGDFRIYGDASSAVLLTSSFRGGIPAILAAPLPTIAHRIGFDINIVDPSLSDQAAWLRALIWPEHHERRSRLDMALQQHDAVDLDLRVGDGFALLADLAAEIPTDVVLCVYHTHVANQISKEAQQTFLASVAEIGEKRDIIHVFNNIHPTLHLTAYRAGQLIDMPLAHTDAHARWIEWLPNDDLFACTTTRASFTAET